ncbi:hypothetical protein Tco_1202769 [Tanacetum coccineum]
MIKIANPCPKDSEGDARMKPARVDKRGASDKNEKDAQDTRSESERLNQTEIQTEHTNSTNSINTVSTPVSTAGPSFDNAIPLPPVNTDGPSVSTANAFEEHLFEQFSPFKNSFTLPSIPNVSLMDNTGIFRNAYDDVEEEVNMNNVDTSYTTFDAPFTKFLKDHPQDQSLNDLLESQVINKFKTRLRYNAATAASPAVEIFVNLSDKSRSDKGYHSVPPPYTGNFIPRKPDLTFIDEIVESENMDVTTVITPSDFKKDMSNHKSTGVKNNGDAVESKTVRENNFIPPIIEDWNSNDESKVEPNDKTVRPSTEKIKSIKTVRGTDAPKQNKHHPRGNQRN